MADPDVSLEVPGYLNPTRHLFDALTPAFTATIGPKKFSTTGAEGAVAWSASVVRVSNKRVVLEFVSETGPPQAFTGFNVVIDSTDDSCLLPLPPYLLPVRFDSAHPAPLFFGLKPGQGSPTFAWTTLFLEIGLARSDSFTSVSWLVRPKTQRILVLPLPLGLTGSSFDAPVTSERNIDAATVALAGSVPAFAADGSDWLLRWQAARPFRATVDASNSGPALDLTDVHQSAQDAPALQGMALLDYDLGLRPGTADHSGFRIAKPPQVTELGDPGAVLFDHGPPIVHVRKAVAERLEVRPAGVHYASSLEISDPLGSITVTGKRAVLRVEATSAPGGSNTIVLEDHYDYIGGSTRIFGGLAIKVHLDFPDSPSVASRLLWDTATAAHTMFLWIDPANPGSLRISDISLDDGQNNNIRQDFELDLTIADTQKAEFFVDPALANPQPGGFRVWIHNLSEIIRATGPGDTTITVKARGFVNPADILRDELDSSATVPLTIKVPPPLEVSLDKYADRYYGAPNSGAAPADVHLATSLDVICDHGTLSAVVTGHNATSTSEHVTMKVTTPVGQQPDLDLLHPTAFSSLTNLSAPVDELAIDGSDGDNSVTIEAWKPINDLVGGVSSQTITLKAVLPTATALTTSAAATVIRRDIGDVSFSYSKALSAYLLDTVSPAGGGNASAPHLFDTPVPSMVSRSATANAARLPAIAGSHELRAVAVNDFDPFAGPATLIQAPRPEISTPVQNWTARPFPERTRSGLADDVGNSNASVDAPTTLRYAISAAQISGANSLPIAVGDPMVNTNVTLRWPANGDLQVGLNSFSISATNEFASPTRTITIARRALVFDCSDGQAGISLVPLVQDGVQLRVTLVPISGPPVIDIASGGGHTFFFNFHDSPLPLGFMSLGGEPFELVEVDDDGDGETDRIVEQPVVSDIQFSISGFIIDPDFFVLSPYIVVQPGLVADDINNLSTAGDSGRHPGDTFWSRVTVFGASGSQSFLVDFIRVF